ncbi:hypothetical protein F5Y03DRAFT_285204 [Xylaria venustula]|nr:hypothetical protein F5Y03DRAFT_285204 [Xylaria venustula]
MLALYIWVSLILPYVWGNTEKTIFLGPSPVDVQSRTYPTLDYLRLISLSPDKSAVRTHLKAEHPGRDSRPGAPSWFVLHNLTESQRYEVRVCWAATQPTTFKMEVYELETVFRAPELTSELSEYASITSSENPHVTISSQTPKPGIKESGIKESILLLRVFTAADYYSTNHTWMENALPVPVDIILDPFLFNILPRSLLTTVIYTVAVAIVSWFMGGEISSWVRQVATEPTKQKWQ